MFLLRKKCFHFLFSNHLQLYYFFICLCRKYSETHYAPWDFCDVHVKVYKPQPKPVKLLKPHPHALYKQLHPHPLFKVFLVLICWGNQLLEVMVRYLQYLHLETEPHIIAKLGSIYLGEIAQGPVQILSIGDATWSLGPS